MKKYEKDLKTLIALSDNGCNPVHQTETEIDEAALMFLDAKGLISLEPAGDDEFWIVMQDKGLTYFSDRGEKRADFIKEHIVSFLSGFVSGVLATIAATWIIQAVL